MSIKRFAVIQREIIQLMKDTNWRKDDEKVKYLEELGAEAMRMQPFTLAEIKHENPYL